MEGWDARHDAEKVDLAFIIDCTGSMGSYIKQVQKHVHYIAETISRTAFNVKLALIEYRDHPPQDRSFTTRVHDFTSSVSEMKKWVDGMSASGGGDWPEAVADGLFYASKLSFRKQATKICVLIADAPPHGLDENGDGFPAGCPKGYDPLKICRTLAENGITLYCIGCEPSVDPFRDFLIGLGAITGGQYVPLHHASTLTKVIINACLEEVSLEKLMGVASDFLYLKLLENQAERRRSTVDELADQLHQHLSLTNNRSRQLRMNNTALPDITDAGRKYSRMTNMSEAKRFYKENTRNRGFPQGSRSSVDEIVELVENIYVSREQSRKLLTRCIARNKVPVTHDEETNEVIVGTIPDDVNSTGQQN